MNKAITEEQARLAMYEHLAQAQDDVKLGRVQTAESVFSDLKEEIGKNETFNAETLAALSEYEEMKTNPSKYKRYASFQEALADLED